MRTIETEIKRIDDLGEGFHGLCELSECLELATKRVKVGEVQNSYGDTLTVCEGCVALVEDDYAERICKSLEYRRAI